MNTFRVNEIVNRESSITNQLSNIESTLVITKMTTRLKMKAV